MNNIFLKKYKTGLWNFLYKYEFHTLDNIKLKTKIRVHCHRVKLGIPT